MNYDLLNSILWYWYNKCIGIIWCCVLNDKFFKFKVNRCFKILWFWKIKINMLNYIIKCLKFY